MFKKRAALAALTVLLSAPTNMYGLKLTYKSGPAFFITVAIGIFAYAYGISFLDLMELKTVDLRFQARGSLAPNPEVILAVIDEKSLEEQGKWVWPRSKIADLINKLSNAGTKVVGFDVGFLEPDDARLVKTIRSIQQEAEIRVNGGEDNNPVYAIGGQDHHRALGNEYDLHASENKAQPYGGNTVHASKEDAVDEHL